MRRRNTSNTHRWFRAAALAVSMFGAAGCADSEPEASDGVVIGLLLPFTGSDSATASNLERAVLFAVERVNAAGGVNGQRVRVVARDTHSELERSRRSASELLDAGAAVVIGPESPEIASEIAPMLAERGALFLSPLIGAASEPSGSCEEPWYRLAPSARSLGEALAKRLRAEGVEQAAVLYAEDEYNTALRDAVERRFVSLGGEVTRSLPLEPDDPSFTDEFEVAPPNADAVVLAMSPRAAALVVNELDALRGKRSDWFLSPLLKTDLLVQNVSPDALQGARGVAPKIYDRSADFPNAFARQWMGDTPLEGAYFYYDAAVLVSFALQKAEREPDGTITPRSLQQAMVAASAPPGESAGWNEIETGLSRLRSGADVYYSGLTGPMLLEACGARKLGATSTWTVDAGRIEDDAD